MARPARDPVRLPSKRVKKSPVHFATIERDLTTLIGVRVRVQSEFASAPRTVDGLLVAVLPPHPSGKGGGVELKRASPFDRADRVILPFSGLRSVHPLMSEETA